MIIEFDVEKVANVRMFFDFIAKLYVHREYCVTNDMAGLQEKGALRQDFRGENQVLTSLTIEKKGDGGQYKITCDFPTNRLTLACLCGLIVATCGQDHPARVDAKDGVVAAFFEAI